MFLFSRDFRQDKTKTFSAQRKPVLHRKKLFKVQKPQKLFKARVCMKRVTAQK